MKSTRSILRWAIPGFLALTVLGCGGGTRQILPGGLVFSQSKRLGTEGGVIHSPRDRIRVVASPGALVNSSDIRLDIYSSQFQAIQMDGWEVHNQGVKLEIDPDAIKAGRILTVEMPFPGPYDAEGTMLAAMNSRGELYALTSRLSPDGTYISADLDFARLDLLQIGADGSHQREEITVFSASRVATRAIPPLVTSVELYSNGQFSGAPPNLSGKRVALLVHGLDSSLSDLTSLGQYVSTFQLPGGSSAYYDVVIGFQYTSNNPLATIGTAMASSLAPIISGANQVDIFCHSMGNVVSRYAMETTTLGSNRLGQYIHHYVSLGGPHTGVPFANIPLLQTLTWIFGGDSYYCILDLATHGEGGAGLTSFLSNLNTTTDGPDFDTANYFTMTGSDYSTLKKGIIPEGDIIDGLYVLSVGLGTVNDGLVAQYSGQNNALARQSSTWVEGPTFDLNHTELHTSQTAFTQIGEWIRAWGQE